jgi:hypothetical protein
MHCLPNHVEGSIHINTNYICSHSLGVFVMRKALQEVESAESDEGSVWSFQRRLFFHFNSDQLLVEQLIKHVMAGPELAQLAAILHSNSAQVRRCNTFAVRENENKTMERKIDQLRTQLMNPMNQALMKQRKWFEARTCQTLQWEHVGTSPVPHFTPSPHFAPSGDRPMPCCDALTAGSYWMLLVVFVWSTMDSWWQLSIPRHCVLIPPIPSWGLSILSVGSLIWVCSTIGYSKIIRNPVVYSWFSAVNISYITTLTDNIQYNIHCTSI